MTELIPARPSCEPCCRVSPDAVCTIPHTRTGHHPLLNPIPRSEESLDRILLFIFSSTLAVYSSLSREGSHGSFVTRLGSQGGGSCFRACPCACRVCRLASFAGLTIGWRRGSSRAPDPLRGAAPSPGDQYEFDSAGTFLRVLPPGSGSLDRR
jgi:hypothetical protein